MTAVPVPDGILMIDRDVSQARAAELADLWQHAARSGKPVVLASGVRFRQRLPDGTFEPDYAVTPSVELDATARDPWPLVGAVATWGFGLVNLLLLLLLVTR